MVDHHPSRWQLCSHLDGSGNETDVQTGAGTNWEVLKQQNNLLS